MVLSVLLIVLGLVMLKVGADWFVRGSSSLARSLRVSELAIGLTIVAFGTSAPELVVNVFAAHQGNTDITFGNVIGSNSFNICIILSITSLILPLRVQSSTAWREIPFSLAALVLLFLLANDALIFSASSSRLGRPDALVFLLGFSLFLWYAFRQLREDSPGGSPQQEGTRKWTTALLIAGGLAGLVAGGKLVLDHAVRVAESLGMSEKLIGLTIVAAGTSLPELATSVVAAMKRNADIAVGNIIGSNIFNILFILPASSLIRPLPFRSEFNGDLYFLAGATLILMLAMYTGKRKTIDRWEAFVLLAAYMGYMVYSAR